MAFAFRGETDRAIAEFERARRAGWRLLVDFDYFTRIEDYPMMARIAKEPRFVALVRAIEVDNAAARATRRRAPARRPIMTSIVRDNPELERYEMRVEGGVAFVIRRSAGVVTLLCRRCRRIWPAAGSARNWRAARSTACRAEGSKAVPVCSYLVAWAKRHPEVHDLLA